MTIIKGFNWGVRFLLELGMLAAVGNWGFTMGTGWSSKLVFALAGPLLVAVVWGLWGSPKAIYRLSGRLLFGLELLVFGAGPMALFATQHVALAWAFILIYLVNKGFLVQN